MDESLYEKLKAKHETEVTNTESTEKKDLKTWLVFRSYDGTYAIESCNVREVMRNNEVYPIPFTPPYVKGVINFYGRPYAVVDFTMLQNLPRTDTQLFLIFNNAGDIALQINDIIDFYTSEDVEEQQIPDKGETEFFSQTISIGNIIAPVLDVRSIATKVKQELENE
ncbi:MAG: CheW domain-containing protein [Treponema sp.]|nr:CheW domain-containing protein [Candidatus Treponema equi]